MDWVWGLLLGLTLGFIGGFCYALFAKRMIRGRPVGQDVQPTIRQLTERMPERSL